MQVELSASISHDNNSTMLRFPGWSLSGAVDGLLKERRVAVWGVRADQSDQADAVIGLARPHLPDLRQFADWDALAAFLAGLPASASSVLVRQHAAQIWTFAHEITLNDLIAVLLPCGKAVHLAEATGTYRHVIAPDGNAFHQREVRWVLDQLPVGALEPDLRHSLRSIAAVRRIRCLAAEERLRRLATGAGTEPTLVQPDFPVSERRRFAPDLVNLGRDAILSLLRARYWGARCEALVHAVLEAEGYCVISGGPGPDGGIDLLAGSGLLGFGTDRLAVQIKAGRRPVTGIDLAAFEASMARCSAATGLIVSLAGFAGLNIRAAARGGFRIRLWDEEALLDAMLRVYDRLPDAIRRDLPLKRVWVPDVA
jgi:restriction system protein